MRELLADAGIHRLSYAAPRLIRELGGGGRLESIQKYDLLFRLRRTAVRWIGIDPF